ncbi:MAG: DUF4190 domain-containing protein [Nakamurella sp.]
MTTGPYGESTAAPDPYGYQPGNVGDPSLTPDPASGYATPGYPSAGYPAPGYSPTTYPAQGYPGYGAQPTAYGAYQQPRNGLGTAALVLGIIGIVLCWIPFTGWILNILAVTFGAIGRKRGAIGEATNKSSAVAGLVLGIIGLAVWVVIFVGFLAAWNSVRYM